MCRRGNGYGVTDEPYMLDVSRFLPALGVEVATVASVAHSAGGAEPVPTCPGWGTAELVRHLGDGYRVARRWLAAAGNPPQQDGQGPEWCETLVEYLWHGYRELRAELDEHDPAEYTETWWPADSTHGFWRRRMLHETIIHRVDLQTATGIEPRGISGEVAVDGIDEVLTLWLGQRASTMGLAGTRECTVAVQTDGHGWLAHAGPRGTSASACTTSDIEKGDVVVRGEPVPTYLWLWGRAAPGAVTVEGADEDAAGQLWALLRLATR